MLRHGALCELHKPYDMIYRVVVYSASSTIGTARQLSCNTALLQRDKHSTHYQLRGLELNLLETDQLVEGMEEF